ncbi:hypothetical protein [Roseofilum capinflatum]|uniref:Uncharacterized protein n=1 Tax=Roseofilum capinflatum BLCC-M114 TaxID=3022440 RepID=A0ABT7BA88_9CYAN|nr:hypothetical protein [Roseofilum capinflatum]MDJ1175519.1 hypothetical protein [Roseofilum capinflatum BLCC-M114]
MTQLTLNLAQGSVSFNFTPEAAQDLKGAINQLMDTLKASAAKPVTSGRKAPQPPMEYRHNGEVFLEVFCNPNIYATPFAAKVLVTLKSDRLRLSTEAELTRVIEDLNAYLE